MNSLFDLYNRVASHEVEAPHNACEGCRHFFLYLMAPHPSRRECGVGRPIEEQMPQHCDLFKDLEEEENDE